MHRRGRFAALLAGTGVAAVAALPAHADVRAYRFHADHVLGTSLDLVAVAADPASALLAAEAARREIDRLDAVLSGWRADSELSALNATGQMQVSPDLFRVLAACERWRAATGGAFDGRLGSVLALWRAAEASGVAPDPARLHDLGAAIASAGAGLDPATRTVTRPAGVAFAPEALAKGYVIDAALAVARAAAPGLAGLMLDIGGDLRCWGRAPGAEGWTVGVADPHAAADNDAPAVLLQVADGAVATSGPGVRDLKLGGATYPHLIGGGANSATAVAASAMDADALATALAVMAPAEGIALVDRLDGAEARVVDPAGGVHTSSGWAGLARGAHASASPAWPGPPPGADARLIRIAAAPAAPWPARFAVTVDYELPQFRSLRVYSPYVAIWVTDQDNRLVRALTMLGDNLDYVSENYIWWRRYGRSRPQLVSAVSRPTRRAGRYSAVWDGRDDMGRAVGQGGYTVHIEAVREDGGHSYQSVPLVLAASPLQAGAPAEDELGAATVRYGRR
jgi:thiamine biosynthesis lipoprotein